MKSKTKCAFFLPLSFLCIQEIEEEAKIEFDEMCVVPSEESSESKAKKMCAR